MPVISNIPGLDAALRSLASKPGNNILNHYFQNPSATGISLKDAEEGEDESMYRSNLAQSSALSRALELFAERRTVEGGASRTTPSDGVGRGASPFPALSAPAPPLFSVTPRPPSYLGRGLLESGLMLQAAATPRAAAPTASARSRVMAAAMTVELDASASSSSGAGMEVLQLADSAAVCAHLALVLKEAGLGLGNILPETFTVGNPAEAAAALFLLEGHAPIKPAVLGAILNQIDATIKDSAAALARTAWTTAVASTVSGVPSAANVMALISIIVAQYNAHASHTHLWVRGQSLPPRWLTFLREREALALAGGHVSIPIFAQGGLLDRDYTGQPLFVERIRELLVLRALLTIARARMQSEVSLLRMGPWMREQVAGLSLPISSLNAVGTPNWALLRQAMDLFDASFNGNVDWHAVLGSISASVMGSFRTHFFSSADAANVESILAGMVDDGSSARPFASPILDAFERRVKRMREDVSQLLRSEGGGGGGGAPRVDFRREGPSQRAAFAQGGAGVFAPRVQPHDSGRATSPSRVLSPFEMDRKTRGLCMKCGVRYERGHRCGSPSPVLAIRPSAPSWQQPSKTTSYGGGGGGGSGSPPAYIHRPSSPSAAAAPRHGAPGGGFRASSANTSPIAQRQPAPSGRAFVGGGARPSSGGGRPSPSAPAPGACFKCGQMGHKAIACTRA
jgi:hypothetical protein